MRSTYPRLFSIQRRHSFGSFRAFYRSQLRPPQFASLLLRTLARVLGFFTVASTPNGQMLRLTISFLSYVAGAFLGVLYMIWLFRDIMFNTIR